MNNNYKTNLKLIITIIVFSFLSISSFGQKQCKIQFVDIYCKHKLNRSVGLDTIKFFINERKTYESAQMEDDMTITMRNTGEISIDKYLTLELIVLKKGIPKSMGKKKIKCKLIKSNKKQLEFTYRHAVYLLRYEYVEE